MRIFVSAPSVLLLCLRFLVFLLKVALAALFVMFLQIQIGQKTLEQWMEEGLRHSAFSQMVREKLLPASIRDKYVKPAPLSSMENIIKKNTEILNEASQQLKEDIKDF